MIRPLWESVQPRAAMMVHLAASIIISWVFDRVPVITWYQLLFIFGRKGVQVYTCMCYSEGDLLEACWAVSHLSLTLFLKKQLAQAACVYPSFRTYTVSSPGLINGDLCSPEGNNSVCSHDEQTDVCLPNKSIPAAGIRFALPAVWLLMGEFKQRGCGLLAVQGEAVKWDLI